MSVYQSFDKQLYPLCNIVDLSDAIEDIALHDVDPLDEEDYEYIPQPVEIEEEEYVYTASADDNEEEF